MSQLADLIRPKSGDAGGAVVVAMPGLPVQAGGVGETERAGEIDARDLDAAPGFGVQRSEESEALHRLLVDTRRKIDDLDSLKHALDDMVLPFRGAMRALDQERALSAQLARQLSEKTALCDRLRESMQAADNRTRLIENEAEGLRDALEKAREAGYLAESARAALADEIHRRDARVTALERQLEQETVQRRSLNEACGGLKEQARQADGRIVQLQSALVEAGQACDLLKREKRSLRQSADQARAEAERLARRAAEGEGMLGAIRAELGKVEARYLEVGAERSRLAGAADELRQQHEAECQRLNSRIAALESRAATAERRLAETRQRLIDRTEEARGFICKAADATMARAAAERRLETLQALHGAPSSDVDPTETRTALSEYLRALNLKSREMALAGAAERLAARGESPRTTATDSRPRGEANAVEAAASQPGERRPRRAIEEVLESARRIDARLETEAASLRAGLVHAGPGEGAPTRATGTVQAPAVETPAKLDLPAFEAPEKPAASSTRADSRAVPPVPLPAASSGGEGARPGVLARKAELVAKLRRPPDQDVSPRSVA